MLLSTQAARTESESAASLPTPASLSGANGAPSFPVEVSLLCSNDYKLSRVSSDVRGELEFRRGVCGY